MADREGSSSSPWIAFLAGIILVAIVALGIAAYNGYLTPRQETAQLETPDVNLNTPNVNLPPPPDVNLPQTPPAPTTPPSAEPNTNQNTTPPPVSAPQ